MVYVNNTGSVNDNFNLSTAGTPAGWSVVFKNDGGSNNCSTVGTTITSTGTINAGSNKLVCAEVTVPATTSNQAAPGTYTLDFTAASTTNGSVTDSMRDAVVIATVNAVEYGLTASIWTNDLSTAHRTALAVQAGYVWINEVSKHFLGAPFGGFKNSGSGMFREMGKGAIEFFTKTKTIYMDGQ